MNNRRVLINGKNIGYCGDYCINKLKITEHIFKVLSKYNYLNF